MIGRLRGLGGRGARWRAAELLERFDLVAAAGRPVSTYSGGMRRRLDLAMSLVCEPRVLFLDEPTTGLDPHSRLAVWEAVGGLAASGVPTDGSAAGVRRLLEDPERRDLAADRLELHRPTLDEVFLTLTERPAVAGLPVRI